MWLAAINISNVVNSMQVLNACFYPNKFPKIC